MPSTIAESVPKPLKFYDATTIKRFCFDSGFIESETPIFLAKWEELYVIARNETDYFITTETEAQKYVRSHRDDKNKLVKSENAPVIFPQGERFQWTAECGKICPDGCDDIVIESIVATNKLHALALVAEWDGVRVRGRKYFLRIRGPAFYQIRHAVDLPRPTTREPSQVVRPVSGGREHVELNRLHQNGGIAYYDGGRWTRGNDGAPRDLRAEAAEALRYFLLTDVA